MGISRGKTSNGFWTSNVYAYIFSDATNDMIEGYSILHNQFLIDVFDTFGLE